jgi:hypothetical protein
MPNQRNKNYANREIELAKEYLKLNPGNTAQKDRLAWWSAYLGDLGTARQYAVSEKVKDYIRQCEKP